MIAYHAFCEIRRLRDQEGLSIPQIAKAMDLNPNGAGVAAGLMWCAVAEGDREGALEWAGTKAAAMGVDPEPTRQQALRALEKRSAGT